jgi:pimeloyl-ACP methyl ester carboxylesterase
MREFEYQGLSPLGFHRLAYVEWQGPASAPPAICVHGLTLNGRVFDRLARALAQGRRVLCPDIVGRGRSDRLAEAQYYAYPQYLADMTGLLARCGAASVDWVGTSMGGIIGMMLAAQPNSPIRRLVLNDVGPFIPKNALERIATYVGRDPRFPDLAAFEAHIREIYAPFGALRDPEWSELAIALARPLPEGGFGFAYDPAIGAPFRAKPPEDVDLWPLWDAIRCPVLVLRGATSDLLPAEVASNMCMRGPGARLVEIPGAGHAPALMSAGEIAPIAEFLSS